MILFRIDERREAVVAKRQKVKTLSSERARKLQASLAWQQFSRDSDEVSHDKEKWCLYKA